MENQNTQQNIPQGGAPRHNNRRPRNGRPNFAQKGREGSEERPGQNAAPRADRNQDPRRDGSNAPRRFRDDRDNRDNRDFAQRPPRKSRAEETVEDIAADIVRIEKEIELEIREIRSMKLGL